LRSASGPRRCGRGGRQWLSRLPFRRVLAA
jgi:hypothetical protein